MQPALQTSPHTPPDTSPCPPAAAGSASAAAPSTDYISKLAASCRFEDAKLPTLPDAVVHLEKAMRDDSLSLAGLAALLEKDPVLATRLIRIANSAFYRGVNPIECVSDAVSRVGLVATRNISLLALKHAFRACHAAVGDAISALWTDSLHVATFATVLATHTRLCDPNRAMLGGLIHNVGPMLLLTVLDERLAAEPSDAEIATILRHQGARFGELLLSHWSMDPDLIEVARHRDDWAREHAGPADLADLVLVARACHQLSAEERDAGARVLEKLPAYRRVMALAKSDTPLPAVLEAAGERIEAALAALSG